MQNKSPIEILTLLLAILTFSLTSAGFVLAVWGIRTLDEAKKMVDERINETVEEVRKEASEKNRVEFAKTLALLTAEQSVQRWTDAHNFQRAIRKSEEQLEELEEERERLLLNLCDLRGSASDHTGNASKKALAPLVKVGKYACDKINDYPIDEEKRVFHDLIEEASTDFDKAKHYEDYWKEFKWEMDAVYFVKYLLFAIESPEAVAKGSEFKEPFKLLKEAKKEKKDELKSDETRDKFHKRIEAIDERIEANEPKRNAVERNESDLSADGLRTIQAKIYEAYWETSEWEMEFDHFLGYVEFAFDHSQDVLGVSRFKYPMEPLEEAMAEYFDNEQQQKLHHALGNRKFERWKGERKKEATRQSGLSNIFSHPPLLLQALRHFDRAMEASPDPLSLRRKARIYQSMILLSKKEIEKEFREENKRALKLHLKMFVALKRKLNTSKPGVLSQRDFDKLIDDFPKSEEIIEETRRDELDQIFQNSPPNQR